MSEIHHGKCVGKSDRPNFFNICGMGWYIYSEMLGLTQYFYVAAYDLCYLIVNKCDKHIGAE